MSWLTDAAIAHGDRVKEGLKEGLKEGGDRVMEGLKEGATGAAAIFGFFYVFASLDFPTGYGEVIKLIVFAVLAAVYYLLNLNVPRADATTTPTTVETAATGNAIGNRGAETLVDEDKSN